MTSKDNNIQAGKYWDRFWSGERGAGRTRWWESPHIIRHVNEKICGQPLEGWNAGPVSLLKQILPEGHCPESALSVGCGTGTKEMNFLEKNLVQRFICFELSEKSIEIGRKAAAERGLSDRILFINDDFFASAYADMKYDMVFWDNSLHHMPDAAYAVQKSYDVLNEGGIFFCNDFAGRSKFQWTDMELAIVNGIRTLLPDEIFCGPEGRRISRQVYRMTIEQMNMTDPSEAADSSSIVPAIQKTFQEPLIIPTGGLVYHLCLNNILTNIPEEAPLLDYMLQLDDETVKMGFLHYIFALGIK